MRFFKEMSSLTADFTETGKEKVIGSDQSSRYTSSISCPQQIVHNPEKSQFETHCE